MFETLIWLKEVSSTQDILKEGNYSKGTVIVADIQKRGKGRKGRRWESQEGGLYFSFVLKEEDFKETLQTPIVVGYALSEFVEHLGFRTGIKWPNDVYVAGKKLAGVLVEKSGEKIVVGVGLNVNQASFPKDIEGRATSLRLIAGREFDRAELLLLLLSFISRELERYMREGFEPFHEKVERKLLYVGEEVVLLSEESKVGTLRGIDREGFLLLETSEGLEKITAGDISLRLPHQL